MLLDIYYTEFRNFLSYGNQWIRFDIKPGIHCIVGEDVDRKRSNGSGKSSCLEPIAYGLFGQTIKELTKARIINWKNKKNCEVKINFKAITGDMVTIHRGMKPNIFAVWVNDKKLETTAKAPEFQKEIEETYIGMDFKTFSGIVHSNPNNSISLLNTKKDQKRQFLERLFNLESYSQLVKVINEKLRSLNNSLISIESDLKHKTDHQETCIRQLDDAKTELKSLNTTELDKEIKELSTQLDDLKLVSAYNYDVDMFKKEREESREHVNLLDIEKEGHKTKRTELEIEQKSLKDRKSGIGDLSEKRVKVDKANERIKDLEKIDFEDRLSGLNLEIERIDNRFDELEAYRVENSDELSDIRAGLSNLPSVGDLEGKPSCPTCGQDVDYERIKESTETDKKKLESSKQKIDVKVEQLKVSLKTNEDNDKMIRKDIKDLEDKQHLLEKLKLTVESVNLDDKEKELDIIDKRLGNIYNEIEELDNKIASIDDKHTKMWDEQSELKKKIDQYDDAANDIEDKNKEISLAKEKLELHEKNRVLFEKRVSDNELVVAEAEKSIKAIEKANIKSTTIKDYLTYIKLSLNEGNVKQYAISSILPFLNRQTNNYLSETGHSFYLLIDGWMDVEIHGVGLSDCSFANLSGGEAKSVDLAIKFACMDVARMMSTASTNILILDEILDSSLDAYGVQQLMDIISLKQKENDLAVYIISHRLEVGDIDFDSTVKVIKENGYSHILND